MVVSGKVFFNLFIPSYDHLPFGLVQRQAVINMWQTSDFLPFYIWLSALICEAVVEDYV